MLRGTHRFGGSHGEAMVIVPVKLPELACLKAPLDDAAERREIAARFAEHRTVRAGMAINKAESFEGWKAIGAALAVGKAHALRVTGANAAGGRNYSREFGAWIKQHCFERMTKSVRSVANELAENARALTRRQTCSSRQTAPSGCCGWRW